MISLLENVMYTEPGTQVGTEEPRSAPGPLHVILPSADAATPLPCLFPAFPPLFSSFPSPFFIPLSSLISFLLLLFPAASLSSFLLRGAVVMWGSTELQGQRSSVSPALGPGLGQPLNEHPQSGR